MAADDVTLMVTGEAAAMNHVADVIGDWADRKGFREDWDDADWLDELGACLRNPENHDFTDIQWRKDKVEERLQQIAAAHRRMANVTKLMLMVSELSEALEGMRDGGNYGEELADLVIRAFENAQKNHVPIGDEIIKKVDSNEARAHKHGRQF